jgi:large subunit ribosomal protein L24
MKPDTERKKYHKEKLHKRKKRLHSHLSKELRSKLKNKRRAVQVRKGDTVKVMRGPGKGKQAKVSRVNTVKRKVFVEGVVIKTAKGRENLLPLEASNLMLVALEATRERKELFSEDIFKKAEKPKKEKPEAKEEAKAEAPKEAPKKAESPKAVDAPKPAAPKPQDNLKR